MLFVTAVMLWKSWSVRSKDYIDGILVVRESEGTFQYGNYWREADDLHAVIQHFSGENRAASTILGHSKGALDCFAYM